MEASWNVRAATAEDHAIFSEWFDAHNEPRPPMNFLPPDCYIVERDGEPVLTASFALTLATPVAYVDYVCSRPKTSGLLVAKAVKKAVAFFWENHGGPYGIIRGLAKGPLAKAVKKTGATVNTNPSNEVFFLWHGQS